MALVDDINVFVDKANTKIGLYTDEIQVMLSQGMDSKLEVDYAAELIDFIESLTYINCPWTDAEKEHWMAFMEVRHNLTDIVYQDYDPYVLPSIVILGPGAGGVTLSQVLALLVPYTTKDNSLQSQINDLQTQIDNLLPPTLVADVSQLIIDLTALTVIVNGHTVSIDTLLDTLTDHILDTDVHIQPGERDLWTAKVSSSELTTALATKSDVGHTHSIANVTGLQTALDALANAIALAAGDDGITPSIQIGSVVEGPVPLVELDPSSTPEIPIFNFTLKSGAPFRIDQMGLLADRSSYDAQAAGFTYLDIITGFLYFRIGAVPGTWSNPILFLGYSGWSPVLAAVVVNDTTVVHQVIDWVGGTGNKPDLDVIYSQPPGTLYYIGSGGIVFDTASAVNIKGITGDRFKIDNQGATRATYDAELKGFTFLNTTTGKISFKLSNTSADWSFEYQWSSGSAAPIISASANTSGGTISLDFASSPDRSFYGSALIGAIKIWAFANDINAFRFTFLFQITAGFAQTLPSSVKMDDTRWSSSLKKWTALVSGYYKAVGEFDGTTWYVDITKNKYN